MRRVAGRKRILMSEGPAKVSMTPRERWMALFQGKRPDRVPCDYWGTAEITARLKHDLDCGTDLDLWRRLGVDKCVMLGARHPRARESDWHLPSLFSLFGIETRPVEYGDGIGTYQEVSRPPLHDATTIAELEDCPWPDARDFDYDSLRAECSRYWPEYPVLGVTFEPFYLYCRLRGMERALEDILANPEMAFRLTADWPRLARNGQYCGKAVLSKLAASIRRPEPVHLFPGRSCLLANASQSLC